ncbi:serine--tRNA ligase [Helicobacter sp. 23-1044]
MIDIKSLLNDFSRTAERLGAKGVDCAKLDFLKQCVEKYKSTLQNLESLRAAQNAKSKDFFERKKAGANSADLQNELANLKAEISRAECEFRIIESQTNELLLEIPNIPDERTPFGKSESENVEIKKIGTPKDFDFAPKAHYELGESNKWIDFEVGVKLAKSRFSLLRGGAAKLNRALINFMLEHNSAFGFEEIATPVIVNRDSLLTTGQLPKFENDMFKIASFIDTSTESPESSKTNDSRGSIVSEKSGLCGCERENRTDGSLTKRTTNLPDLSPQDNRALQKGHDLYLISTAEITLTNMYRDCIISLETLPLKLCAYTPCFRKEAGSAGRDTRGIIRQHQFDKVELVAITTQERSDKMQDFMVEVASGILQKLELPHRMIQLCSGDLGFSASNTIDIEVWLPYQNCYREISSISNTRDFQSRRGRIRYKDGKKNILAHTLNGSSLAVGRTLVAIMENYQQKDGEIAIPTALKKYL